MGAIGLNPIRFDRIGLDPIRINAIKLGVPGAASDRSYIDPEVLASLKAVCICYGKSNDDPDRAIIKNLVDPDNPFIISNAAYKLNSGYGKYEEDFTTWVGVAISINNGAGFKIERNNTGWWGFYTYGVKATNEFKIKVTNCRDAFSWRYKDAEGIWQTMNITKDGIYTLPASQERDEHDSPRFFNDNPNATYNGLTVEQIPSYQGAFVTDGIDDLITSTKTVQEMLGGSNEITVVSMAHFIKGESNAPEICRINQIRRDTRSIRNSIFKIGKSGIFGYTYKNGVTTINNILGDKNDCTAEGNLDGIVAPFSVEGYYYNNNSNPLEPCSIAWYWTIIANKVLTTDQINQVIAYFNLDRTLKPDILCNTIKQGITNENHAEFGDKLIDFSGNGRDIQLNNIAWDGDSGIGKYSYPGWKLTANKAGKYRNIRIYQTLNGTYTAKFEGVTELYNRVGIELEILSKNRYVRIKEDGIYSVDPVDDATELQVRFGDYTDTELYDCDITITQIPSHAGGLCLDGINDFGKVTGMPIYKDYTVIADYERFYLEPITGGRASILSKSSKVGDGSFIFNLEDQDGGKACYTFGKANGNISDDITRIIRYQSKYYNTKTLSIGTAEDNDFMVLGKVREVDSRCFCGVIYSLMSFPYSMSEFLIERQLKKHKLGTLYPDMVEFRPVIKSNASYDNIVFYYKNEKVENGTYLTVGSSIGMHIRLSSSPVNEIKSITVNGIPATFKYHDANNNIYQYDFNPTSKSPQKIDMIISSYLTMLNNETLISNETLIKNE